MFYLKQTQNDFLYNMEGEYIFYVNYGCTPATS